jgi:hypothetical protein
VALVGRYFFARSSGRVNRPLFSGVPIIPSVKVYHIARVEEAADIEVRGFRDPSNRYLGIWVADRPLLAESGIEIGLAAANGSKKERGIASSSSRRACSTAIRDEDSRHANC